MTRAAGRAAPRTLVQVADYPRGATFGPRRLADFEFVWVLRGSARWTVHGDAGAQPAAVHLLTPGTLGLARSGTVDSYQWDPEQASRHAYVHFALSDSPGRPEERHWPVTRSIAGTPVLEGLCSYLLELAGQQSGLARERSDQVVGLLLDLFLDGPLEEPTRQLPPQLVPVTDHVRRCWATGGLRALGVPELAAAGHVSAGHLYRLFRQAYGCGPARAFELVRLARAAVSLQRSNAGLAEVAQLTGFANPYHFSRRFAAVHGSPPGAFRRLSPAPDPLAPVRAAGLLPVAHAVLDHSSGRGPTARAPAATGYPADVNVTTTARLRGSEDGFTSGFELP